MECRLCPHPNAVNKRRTACKPCTKGSGPNVDHDAVRTPPRFCLVSRNSVIEPCLSCIANWKLTAVQLTLRCFCCSASPATLAHSLVLVSAAPAPRVHSQIRFSKSALITTSVRTTTAAVISWPLKRAGHASTNRTQALGSE